MVLPNFVRQALAGQPITVFGDGSQSQSFTYIGDMVEALVRLMTEPRAVGQVFNIGNVEEISIGQLAERVKSATNSSSPIVLIPFEQAYETGVEDMPRRVPDLTKTRMTSHELARTRSSRESSTISACGRRAGNWRQPAPSLKEVQ
jgi:UDP-glucose 4-epimerase